MRSENPGKKGQWKIRIYKIPFVREGGRLVFDLPVFLKENGLKYKLYKRYNLYDDVCGSGYEPMICCKNGMISWDSDWCGYNYVFSVEYASGASCMKIEGRKVASFRVGCRTYSEKILDYLMKTMEECQNLFFRELGEVLDQLELRKGHWCLDICFTDGTTVTEDEVNWEN